MRKYIELSEAEEMGIKKNHLLFLMQEQGHSVK